MITTTQYEWKDSSWLIKSEPINPQLCLIFGSRYNIEKDGVKAVNELKREYPDCTVLTTSTAGNIHSNELKDDTLIATLIQFERTSVDIKSFPRGNIDDIEFGEEIAQSYNTNNLAYVLLLSTAGINAGSLIKGINNVFNGKVNVSGGVAGDDTRFEKTLVGINTDIKTNNIVTVGFYGDKLEVAHGSQGGWTTFGPTRTITKSKGNILYEIDNIPVLDIYKEYLGPKAKDLPGSGLLFPFAIVDEDSHGYMVRGIQDIDESEKSITLFSDVFNGQTIQLMRADHNRLLDGSRISAEKADVLPGTKPQLALLISCVARRLAMGQLIEEELEEVKEVFGDETTICGFYSYSELSPLKDGNNCELHNQTMTITTLTEL